MRGSQGTDDGMAVIAASFGIGAGLAAPAAGGAEDMALAGAGLPSRQVRRPFQSFSLPPGLLATTAAGTFLDLPMQFGPRSGWLWDITSLTAYGFTAGALAVTKNAPIQDTSGNPIAIEPVGAFTTAGVIAFPQHGSPLLDATERLVFTVTSALTAPAGVIISGSVILVPAERLSEYLS